MDFAHGSLRSAASIRIDLIVIPPSPPPKGIRRSFRQLESTGRLVDVC